MKSNLFMRICAYLLAGCLVISSVTAVQICKAYATDDGGASGDGQNVPDDSSLYENEDGTDPEPEPEPQPDPQPDPFDYDLVCYTPNISFGTVYAGDVVSPKQFGITYIGSTNFPLTWECIDQYTAFGLATATPYSDMKPGDTVQFNIQPLENLKPGTYKASFTFFSANDNRRHHTARVDVSVTVKEATPYVTSVDVNPGNVTLPAGKEYRFDAIVAGGNNYNPAVTWSLAGNQNASTKIDSKGNLSVAIGEPSGSFAVIATSKQDPSVYGRALVTVTVVDYVVSIKADPVDGGAVAGPSSVRSGASATVSASPNNNFVFKGWFEGGNLVSNNGSYTINNINSDRALVAKFERNTCRIKTSVNDSNGGTISGSSNIPYGSNITITAKANSGYTFAGFVENKKTISTAASLQLNNVTSDRDIMAVFNRDTCNVNVYVNPQDTGKYEGGGKVNRGSKVELKATAYDGYEFSGWSIN